jgi:hypothetical protein
MSNWNRDAAIAMERRHIVEGERRIERQQALIARLVLKGTSDLTKSTDLLAVFRDLVDMAKARLRCLERGDE